MPRGAIVPKVYNKYHSNAPDDAVYIGRGSKWGNPYRIGIDGTRDEVISKYATYIYGDKMLRAAAVEELRGRDLLCFCAPKRCHGDILLEIANSSPVLLFFGHRPKTAGVVDASCLSNWFPSPFELGGVVYPTVEHFMMAEKAALFGDYAAWVEIMGSSSPKGAKVEGRRVSGFSEDAWSANKFEIVVTGVLAKFTQNVALMEYLVGTGDAVIAEASPWDTVWGIGLGISSADASDPAKWRGSNLLGKALMQVRGMLR